MCLSGSNTHELRALVREPSGDEDRPESDEFARVARDDVLGKWAGIRPGVESQVPVLADAGVDADAEDDEAEDGDNLDAREPHLEGAEVADGQEVQGREDDPEDGDKDADAEVCVPVLDDDTGGNQLEREGHRPRKPVDPAHGEAERAVDEPRRIHSKRTCYWDESSHLAEACHDGENDGPDEDEGD